MNSLVSCVMITGKDPRRRPLMLAALKSFQLQTYEPRELIIVQDAGEPPTRAEIGEHASRVLTVQVPEKKTLGELRNVGLDTALGGYIVQWDDDDWSAPWRLESQMRVAAANPGAAVTLSHQVRYSFLRDSAFVWGNPRQGNGQRMGIPGTILHPRTDLRYAAAGKHEDSWFLESWPKVSICYNPHRPHTYLRFAHDSNTWSASHIMRNLAEKHRTRLLTPDVNCYLQEVLDQYYQNVIAPDPVSASS